MADTSAANPTPEDVSIPAPSLAVDIQIALQVGESRFTTTKETLVGESEFFASLLSGRWDNALEDGSYFVDADPTLFEHILRYLRRGVFPLFFNLSRGHDYSLYLSLLEEARYFRISRLEDWLVKKRYHGAVKVKHTLEIYDDGDHIAGHDATLAADTMVHYHPSWGTRKVYICPREIFVHRGKPDACGRDCRRVQGDADDRYDEEPRLSMLVVRKSVIFEPAECVC